MPLEDKDIFQAVCSRFSDQPIEYIMEQYEKAKLLNIGIEQRLGNSLNAGATADDENEVAVVEEVEVEPVQPPKKRYTKRSLKVKPQDAITDDYIACCICGAQRQNLTKTHLATHEISVEDYKKLCGYPQDLPLMSNRRLRDSKLVIRRAQQVRLENIRAREDD